MSSFKQIETATESLKTFRGYCDDVAQRIIRAGQNGCLLGKGGKMFTFSASWDERCIELGEKIKDCEGVTPESWMSWMRSAKIKSEYTEIRIFTRSRFFAENIAEKFSNHITEKTNKIVTIVVDKGIDEKIGASYEWVKSGGRK